MRRYRLVRVLQKDRAFVYATIALLVLVGLVGLSLPRWIRTSPEGFSKGRVRVSVVDLIQAWSLARTARRAESAGDVDGALQAWRSAVANNAADAELHRSMLTLLGRATNAPVSRLPLALSGADWLASLVVTNRDDLVLAADVLMMYAQVPVALDLLAAVPAGTSDAVDRARARAHLEAGHLVEFGAAWEAHRAEWSKDEVMAAYADGWTMARDEGTTGIEAGLRLKAAAAKPGAEGLRAARLWHQSSVRRGLVDQAAAAVARLEMGNAATMVHRAQLWQLMARTGRLEEARSLARVISEAPRDPASTQLMVEVMKQLGLTAEARRFLEDTLSGYGTAVGVWRVYFDLLEEIGKWNEIRRASADARVLSGRNEALFGEAIFAGYRAARGQSRTNDAAQLLRELVELRSPDAAGIVRVSARLRSDGFSSQALAILKNHEVAFANSDAFWGEYFQIGRDLKDVSLLRRAVAELLRLQPKNGVWENNRAALLLITGEAPAEALQLTFEGLQRVPRSAALRINHAIALMMNGRGGEAEQKLVGIDASRLEPEAATSFHLLMAEIRSSQGRHDEAVREAALVDRGLLFPLQVERLDRVLEKGRRKGTD